MIIYGLVTETSVTDLFASGFGPGLLLTFALSAYSIWFNRRMPTARFDLGEFWVAFKEGIWAAMMPVILLGGIYSGYFTATEAAAVALAYSLVVEIFVHKELKAGDFYNVVLETSKLGGSLFPLIAVALSLNIILTEHRVPQGLVNFMQGYISSPLMFMILVNLLLLVVGCLMTTGEAILVLAPLLAPLAEVLRLQQGAVRPDHDPQSGDRLPDAPRRPQPDRRHGRLQAELRPAVPCRHPLHRHHDGVPRHRHLATLDRHVPGDGQVLSASAWISIPR